MPTPAPAVAHALRPGSAARCPARRGMQAAMLWAALAVAAPAALARPSPPAPLSGRVTSVVDGDSLWFQPAARAPVEVRLLDIDAPEICQAGGPEARAALRERVMGRGDAQLRIRARDVYGRALARLTVGGTDVARQQVLEGHAWSARGRDGRGPLLKEEYVARALRRGLHAQAGAVMPRDFRRDHGPCRREAAPTAPAVAPGKPLPSPSGTPAPMADRRGPAAAAPATGAGATAERRCDGRRHCSQMTSCEEARWFLTHCPGVTMDGDRDGRPCETTWCRP